MKSLGIVPHQPLDSKKLAPGTRIRIKQVLPYMKETIVTND
jgi:hypothetical protein